MTLGPRTSSTSFSPNAISMPGSGMPMLAGSLRSRRFTLTIGDASVSPYPWQIGSPSPMNVCAICGLRAAPPLMQIRSRPPRRSSSLAATSFLKTGHSRNDGFHGPRFCFHWKTSQPTVDASSKSRRFAGGADCRVDCTWACSFSKMRGTETMIVGRTPLKSSPSC